MSERRLRKLFYKGKSTGKPPIPEKLRPDLLRPLRIAPELSYSDEQYAIVWDEMGVMPNDATEAFARIQEAFLKNNVRTIHTPLNIEIRIKQGIAYSI